MNKYRKFVLLALVVVACLWTFRELEIRANAPKFGDVGPDVIVGDMPSTAHYYTSSFPNDVAFSVGTTSCNIGDEKLDWYTQNNTPIQALWNRHPVISQNLYRVKNGRLEQLGQSWLKHGFFALSNPGCGPVPCQGTDGTQLGVGCSDPYGAGLNGSQGGLGPKSEVNAATGFFPWPPRRLTNAQINSLGGSQDGLAGRIRVKTADLDPALNPDARYFIESQYVSADDCAAGNKNNSISYREVFVDTSPFPFDVDTNGSAQTVQMLPAMHAWKTVHPDVQIIDVDVPDDGRIVVGIRTTPVGEGGFHTEIAIENQTSDRCVQSLNVDCNSGLISVAKRNFNDVDYQFEPYADEDWLPTTNGNQIEWATETFADNADANAIRWGTMYSFWFDSDKVPTELTLGLFKTGKSDQIPLVLRGDMNGDGAFDNLDISAFVLALTDPQNFAAQFPDVNAEIQGDFNADGSFTNTDISCFVAALTGGG